MTTPDFTKPNQEFDDWRATLPETHWAKYDLSACRLGWEAALKWRRGRIEGKVPDSIEPPPIYVDFVAYAQSFVADSPRASLSVAFLCGMCSNIVGKIDDEEWEAMLAVSKMPCGKLDCTCELTSEPLFAGLDAARKEWRQVMLNK